MKMNLAIVDTLKNLIDNAIDQFELKGELNEGILIGHYQCISHILNQLAAFNLLDELDDDYLKQFKAESIIERSTKRPYDTSES